jgi:hypothetical protein
LTRLSGARGGIDGARTDESGCLFGGPDKAGRLMRALACALLVLAFAACSSTVAPRVDPHIVVVDRFGTPIEGALVRPEPEDVKEATLLQNETKPEVRARVSNAQGMIRADLEDYYWETDNCYHFRVHREGFEDFEIAVAKDLMPPVYRIELRDRVEPAK